ncbi:MAG: hypothetical protein NZX77_19125 [Polyangiaceae bacterium]|nr:hypothetical protein [Polyangiaceae bacterium]
MTVPSSPFVLAISVLGQLFLAVLLAGTPAWADLRSDAARIGDFWASAGGAVIRHPPLFLEQGRPRWVKLPAEPGPACLSLALLAPRAVEVSLFTGSAMNETTETSRAGLLVLSRCGPERRSLERVAVELRGARSAIEVITSRGDTPAPDPRQALPERIVAPLTHPLDPGRAPASESLAARIARAEERARASAVEIQRMELSAQREGHGQTSLPLREGCHRIELLAEAGGGGLTSDVDAELRDPRTGTILVRDRSDTADARLELCIAESTTLALSFRGAPARARVVVLLTRWPLPPALPMLWGPRTRAAMAFAIVRRGLSPPRSAPILSFTGLTGSTFLRPELAPGACYLLLLGLARGEARSLSIAGLLDGHILRDEGGSGKDGLVLAFCSQRATSIPLTIETRGGGHAWGAALWRLGTEP